jgi:deferrochelatase/peroxidase EfeB
MTQALVTMIAPLAREKLAQASAAIDALENPARPDIAGALDKLDGDDGTHFTSFHAFASTDGKRAYLLLEFSADGDEKAALTRFCNAIGDAIRPVLSLASDWRDGQSAFDYLWNRRRPPDNRWFGDPGISFAGTPGMSVGRILREAALAAKCTDLLGAQQGGMSALDRLEKVRDALRNDPNCASALTPADPAPPFAPQSLGAIIFGLALDFIGLYLWPFVVAVLCWTLYCGLAAATGEFETWPMIWAFAKAAALAFCCASLLSLGIVIVAGLIAYLLFIKAEAADWLDPRAADHATVDAMFARENHYAQNHMISITRRKPGMLRSFTSRLMFWIIGELAARLYAPGFLSDIGTIHFARWITVKGNRDLVFLSNYGGSWESYLEDFITRAHAGLTGVWSNTVGFPRTVNLFQEGATDGERFKRYARHSMIPTRFWYSAYPTLTTANVRTNAEIRRGLSGALTEDEAMAWLAMFGSARRPESKLESNEIQSIIFGGLGFLHFGKAALCCLPNDEAAARSWLKAVAPYVAFNDGRRLQAPAIFTLALSAEGLKKLGLPDEGLATFPVAFLDGMPSRARLLGDRDANAPQTWRWGGTPHDAAVLIYGNEQSDVDALESLLQAICAEHGASCDHCIPLKEIKPNDKTEPFGFMDGVSQPVIRGTYKGMRVTDSIHLVEPGEFILGYPDNRNNLPPGPTLPALADPDNHLSLVDKTTSFSVSEVECPRDIGANGSFLVIRELEQDVKGFQKFCTDEAARLHDRLHVPYYVDAKFIGAKLIGRWQDGSSLVRHPYHSQDHEDRTGLMSRALGVTLGGEAQKPGPSLDDAHQTRTPPVTPVPPSAAAEEQDKQKPVKPDYRHGNDFLFGTEDPEALRCPYGAHIRRANPRDSLDPGSADQVGISNRHRILRIGRQYQPADGQNPGLFFMCLNGDIERQFEFIQQTWLNGQSFHGLSCEADPLVGAGGGVCAFTVPSRDGPVRLSALPDFVTTKGGGYFFLPGRRLVAYLSRD